MGRPHVQEDIVGCQLWIEAESGLQSPPGLEIRYSKIS